jgi:non-ribosomal peptide synthetase component E (peptide arylation enzyme)
VILGDSAQNVPGSATTVDAVFRRALARGNSRIALRDPPNRASFTDGAPRSLTYAEADRMVSAIAGRLRHMGLQTDAIVGIQLPNIVESVLVLLGVLRAGMIPAPLPLLWRRAEAITALSRVGAKMLVTCRRIGAVEHGDLALHVAAETFPIRYVCAFGASLPDGVVPLDELFTAEKLDPIPAFDVERNGNPAAHVAVITWETASAGIVPIARSHVELLAGGIAVLLESRFEHDAAILSSIATSSFAGLALNVVPWLLVGGTLALHHPFDAAVFAAQRREQGCDTVVLPGPMVSRLAEAGVLSEGDGLRNVVAMWRAPERLRACPAWRAPGISLIDVPVFGEAGLLAARRGADGKPAPIGIGKVHAPRGAADGILALEVIRTAAGTIAVRGPMVPRHAFPPGAERTDAPHFKTGGNGQYDTGYTCRLDRDGKTLVVTGPPAGIVNVGGYRFVARELQEHAASAGNATLTALPDALAGHRLAGSAGDRETVQKFLAGLGLNPLVIAAFRERGRAGAAI